MSAYALPGLFPPVGMFCANDDMHSLHEKQMDREVFRNIETSIRVKKTRIDPTKLIESLTQGLSVLGRRRKNCRDRRFRGRDSALSAQEEAMQFELSICHNGRVYTAVRSLARIRRLREDLCRKDGCRQLHYAPTSWSPRARNATDNMLPELPPLVEDNAKVVRLGFVFLQELLQFYAPVLENWFVQILAQDSCNDTDSSCWTDFLYEPATAERPMVLSHETTLHATSLGCTRLNAILEEPSDAEQDEKEEEPCDRSGSPAECCMT